MLSPFYSYTEEAENFIFKVKEAWYPIHQPMPLAP